MVKYFGTPFANTGEKTDIPNETQVDNAVSYEKGYTPNYSLPKTDPDHRDVERLKQNALFNVITTAIRQYQEFGAPDFITSEDNGGSAFSYSINAMIRYENDVYLSLKNSNTSLPTVANDWLNLGDALASLTGITGNIQAQIDTLTSAVNALVSGAPSGLNTFAEVAAAINNDPNFSVTISAALATKADTSVVNAIQSQLNSITQDDVPDGETFGQVSIIERDRLYKVYPGGVKHLVIVGDSIPAACTGGSTGTKNAYNSCHGIPIQFLAEAKGAYTFDAGRDPITNLSIWDNLGVGGDTVELTEARFDQVLARNPDIIWFHVGTNNVKGGTIATPGIISASFDRMIERAQLNGVSEIWIDGVFPRNATDGPSRDFTASERKLRLKTNKLLAAKARKGVKYFDYDPVFCNATGDMITGLTSDGLHPNENGAFTGSRVPIASEYPNFPPQMSGIFVDVNDVYDSDENEYGSFLTNGLLDGVSGTVGLGMTGQAADNTVIKRRSGTVVTGVLSKGTRTFGERVVPTQKIAITCPGGGSSQEIVRLRFGSDTVPIAVPGMTGKWMEADCIYTISEQTGTKNILGAYILAEDQSGAKPKVQSVYKDSSNTKWANYAREIRLPTPPMQLVGESGVFVDFQIEVDATLVNSFVVEICCFRFNQRVISPS